MNTSRTGRTPKSSSQGKSDWPSLNYRCVPPSSPSFSFLCKRETSQYIATPRDASARLPPGTIPRCKDCPSCGFFFLRGNRRRVCARPAVSEGREETISVARVTRIPFMRLPTRGQLLPTTSLASGLHRPNGDRLAGVREEGLQLSGHVELRRNARANLVAAYTLAPRPR